MYRKPAFLYVPQEHQGEYLLVIMFFLISGVSEHEKTKKSEIKNEKRRIDKRRSLQFSRNIITLHIDNYAVM